jgi:hypothetical protein
MADNKSELKNLSPTERIKKLKEQQEKSKKEIEEAQKLIKESEAEEAQEEDLRQKIPVPQLKAVDIDSLFSPEEKEIFRLKRYIEEKKAPEKDKKQKRTELEAIAEEAPRQRFEQPEIRQYGFELSREPANVLREKAEGIYSQFKETGHITYEQKKELDTIGFAEAYKMNDIKAGSYDADRRAVDDMVVTQKIKNWLQDKYKGRSQD